MHVKHGVTSLRIIQFIHLFGEFHLFGVPKYAKNGMTFSQQGRTFFSMNIETQMFKYFQRYPKLIEESFSPISISRSNSTRL